MLIIGPPGSGKGTQAERLSRHLGISCVSTGEIFREQVRLGTALGREVMAHLDSGDLVPDSVTNELVRERLNREDLRNGFILDGYPRNSAQVSELEAILAVTGHRLDMALQLTVDDEELIRRMLMRAALTRRSDDTEDIMRHRLALYYQETHPITSLYLQSGILVNVDGSGTEDQVFERSVVALTK
ncbi:adenylate kinase [Arthrobacter sp. ISL-30]|uniref:adenylate kinase n=1 Tax=Arthrobacter sp. ISL-30 TaxID=2819109 RepID=UPI001BE9528B|nr:adenylate kinase [Arthrobacter sp. ISL-30]MBT2513474.1 adenylate kinase [Arthrobacter sp. ISL-30]